MAKMIPGDVTQMPVNTNSSEKAIYKLINKHTPDEWICYAGQMLCGGSTPDFVLIGPDLGMLVLEVKDIPINLVQKFTTENWTIVIDSHPEEKTHPLRQARSYVENSLNSLKKCKRLLDKKGRLKFTYGHGVILKAISRSDLDDSTKFNIAARFDTPPIDTFDPLLVVTSDELPNLRDSKSNFAEHLLRMTNRFAFDKLDENDIQTIRWALFPEIRARVLSDELHDRDEILETLTVEQEQMARGKGNNDTVPHRLINGVAGCGKSIVLRTRATCIAREHPEWNILVSFFTRSLKNYLGKNLPLNVDVQTIGQILDKQYKSNCPNSINFDAADENSWSEITNYIKNMDLSKGKYQAVLFDECQDLSGVQADLLRHLLDEKSNCAFFCGDKVQNIFNRENIVWKDHGFNFHGRSSEMDYSCNYRNTKAIFDFAWEFISENVDSDEPNKGLLKIFESPYSKVVCKRIGPKPIMKEYANSDAELLAIAKETIRLVINEKISFGRIGILHPFAGSKHEDLITTFIEMLDGKGIPCYWLSKDSKNKINYDPDINKVTISTPDSAKGLEWDIVFMPSINRYYSKNPDALKFVAAMRARNILYPSSILV